MYFNSIYHIYLLLFQSNQTLDENISELGPDQLKNSIYKKYIPEKDNPNSAQKFETLLQKEEEALRQHISVEHQLKIQCEKYAEKVDLLENQKTLLIEEFVSKIN